MPDQSPEILESPKRRINVVKFMELGMTIACLCLHYYSFNDGDIMTGFLATGTYCGFIVILLAVFAGHLMRTPISKRLDIFYSLIGSSMFIASGVFVIDAWKNSYRTDTRDLAILKGALSIVNGILFVFDSIFTFKE